MNAVSPRPRRYLIVMKEQVIALDLSEMIAAADPGADATIASTVEAAGEILKREAVRAVFWDSTNFVQPQAAEVLALAAGRSTLVRLGDGPAPATPSGSLVIDLPFTDEVVASILASIMLKDR